MKPYETTTIFSRSFFGTEEYQARIKSTLLFFFGGAADFFDSPEMFLPQEPTRGLLIQAEINLLGEHHTLSPVPKALVVEVLVVLDDRTPHFAVAKEISQMQ
jgi:hypothetical protein